MLYMVNREGLCNKVTFQGKERTKLFDIWGKSILSRGKKYESPKAGEYLKCSRNCQEPLYGWGRAGERQERTEGQRGIMARAL